MIAAYVEFWRNYVNFLGRSTRSEYWFVVLMQILIAGVLGVILGVTVVFGTSDVSGVSVVLVVLLWLYSLASIIPSLSLSVRRLRDGGFPWGLIFIQLIPWLGAIAFFILTCMPSKNDRASFFDKY